MAFTITSVLRAPLVLFRVVLLSIVGESLVGASCKLVKEQAVSKKGSAIIFIFIIVSLHKKFELQVVSVEQIQPA